MGCEIGCDPLYDNLRLTKSDIFSAFAFHALICFNSSVYVTLRKFGCKSMFVLRTIFGGEFVSNFAGINFIHRDLKSKEKILFIISHPDDECMFFGPAILNLTICKEKKIFLLCFSYGDYNQKGRQRKQELWQSCSFLGIPESNIFLQKISVLPDDPKRMWNENVIFRIIINYVETFHFDAVVSFDKDGISGHPNHKAIYYGLAHTLANESFPDYCSIYCLDSVNKFRKYSFILDFLFSICFSSNWFILPPSRCYLVKKAMKAHRTQYVWFRKLYIWISRYAYINTFSLLYANEAIFDLNFRGVCD
ncbi:hypothetical protein PGB90_004938 [Kerria lacca]